MTTFDACSFSDALPSRLAHPLPLHPTAPDWSTLHGSSATLIDWMQSSERWRKFDLSVWLRIRAANTTVYHPSFLMAECPLRLRCHDSEAVVVTNSGIVLRSALTVSAVYACVQNRQVTLLESLYAWVGHGLVQRETRLLLDVRGGRAPFTATSIHEARAYTAAVVVMRSAHHTHLFHLRRDVAAQEGRVPPVAVLPLQGPLTHHNPQRRHGFVGGCLTESVVGVVSYDAHRHTSTFHLAAVQTAQALLEVSTPALHDADGALIPSCGLAQRLVYASCALTRAVLKRFPVQETTTVVLEVRVEAAVEGNTASTSLSLSSIGIAAKNVTWRTCGAQRYESVVRRQHSSGGGEWTVEPLVKVWSRPGVAADTTLSEQTRRFVGERRAVSCVLPRASRYHLLRFPVLAAVSKRPSCMLESSAAGSLPFPPGVRPTGLLSAVCQRMFTTWWHLPPPVVSRWVCTATHCSMSEWCLLCIVGAVLSLLLRLLVRSKPVRWLRCSVVGRWWCGGG